MKQVGKYDPEPTICNICKGNVVFKKMEEVGLPPYQSGYCYICENCRAYVGTHRKERKKALGILAKPTTRWLRAVCHEEFDTHWKTSSGKSRAYFRLSKELGIKKEDCHFGHMDEKMLNEALYIMRSWGDLDFK